MMASLTLTAMPLSVWDPGCAPRTKPSGRSRAARAMDETNFIKRRAECRKPLPAGQGPDEAPDSRRRLDAAARFANLLPMNSGSPRFGIWFADGFYSGPANLRVGLP